MDNLDYGIIGNCRSCALVSRSGSIDWCCLADFDSPSVFAALLDPDRGGSFAFEPPNQPWEVEQGYLPRTNLLSTEFVSQTSRFQVVDFMPRYRTDRGDYHCPPDVLRLLIPLAGAPELRIRFRPRLGYAEHPTRILRFCKYLKAETTEGPHESVYLYSDLSLEALADGLTIQLNRPAFLWLSYNQKLGDVSYEKAILEMERTKVYWMNWCERTITNGRYTEAVQRSSLVLKLLSYQSSGALLAAATTSLPEALNEERNWDYRFCWIRDASMTIRSLVNLGHPYVARRFFDFLLDVVPYKNDRIQIMYGIRGQKELTETMLPWLSGYHGSRPVRIGNAAWSQTQNDIYGVLLDVLYQGFVLFHEDKGNLEALWTMTRGITRHIEAHWQEPDQGIWEIRGAPRHFTHSKLMCWVGLDRAAKIASLVGAIDLVERWSNLRDRIRADILERGWNPERNAFTQSYGSKDLDAANLLMWRWGFLPTSDPRWVGTVRTSYEELCRDGLMYRYRNLDDFGETTSSFTSCTFWMIQALGSIGESELAQKLFEDLLRHANHLGLFSEDLDFASRRLLGNFPQAYSHLALIDTAFMFEKLPHPAVHMPLGADPLISSGDSFELSPLSQRSLRPEPPAGRGTR